MIDWPDIILYGFLIYLLIHLIVDDIVFIYKTLNYRKNLARIAVEPAGVYYGDVEMCDGNYENHAPDFLLTTKQRVLTNPNEQRTIILVFNKLCDVVLFCVMGYFRTFTTCWVATLDCLNSLISKYISFLQIMVERMTASPAVIVLSTAAVASLAITAMIVWIVLPSQAV